MSNGSYRFAGVVTATANIAVDEGEHGEFIISIHTAEGTQEITLSSKQYDDLLTQLNEYECGGRVSEHEDNGVKS
jgi:hypothetical protein